MANSINQLQPQECTNIAEVRNEIDNIDHEIIRLLSRRFDYVREVVKYKDGSDKSIEASDRRTAVIVSRAQWAQESGLSPEVISNLYNQLIDYFIEEEKKIQKNVHP